MGTRDLSVLLLTLKPHADILCVCVLTLKRLYGGGGLFREYFTVNLKGVVGFEVTWRHLAQD